MAGEAGLRGGPDGDPGADLRRTLEELADLRARVDHAQRLAGMGDYDWHIDPDAVWWSDHLQRIFGLEPDSSPPTYEQVVARIHPDDRDQVRRVHAEALATGKPFRIVERIVRPDGTVRHLLSSGEVVAGPQGAPVRFRGACVDITDRVAADRAREEGATRFADLLEASPDAILVIGPAGRVVHANALAADLLGADPRDTDMSRLLDLVPIGGASQGVALRGADGRDLLLDVRTAVLGGEGSDLVAAFLHDAAERLEGEQVAAQLREAHVRRRQALELNDNVVQALTTAGHVLARGDTDQALGLLDQTLESARHLMDEWLHAVGTETLEAGDLVRLMPSAPRETPHVTATRSAPRPTADVEPVLDGSGDTRVLVVDDNADLRDLFALQLTTAGGFVVVGQAGDGAEAVLQATELQPDVVLLDLAMPLMDGLQALPLILEAVPGTKVVVVSGFDEGSLAEKALALGASRYLEKGLGMALPDVVREVLGDRARESFT